MTKLKIHAMEFCDFKKNFVVPIGLFVPCSLTEAAKADSSLSNRRALLSRSLTTGLNVDSGLEPLSAGMQPCVMGADDGDTDRLLTGNGTNACMSDLDNLDQGPLPRGGYRTGTSQNGHTPKRPQPEWPHCVGSLPERPHYFGQNGHTALVKTAT